MRLLGWEALGVVVLLPLVAWMHSAGAPDTAGTAVLVVGAFIVAMFALWRTLVWAARTSGVVLVQENQIVSPQGMPLIGLAWGYFWRSALMNVPTQILLNSLQSSGLAPPLSGMVGILLPLIGSYFAGYWLLRHQMGSTTINHVSEFVGRAHEISVGSGFDSATTLVKTGASGILSSILYASWFATGLVQAAAVYTFFKDVWHWWWLPSVFVSMFVAYIPVIGSGVGVYAAINAWHWSWYWAVLLFFFPLVAIAIVAIGSISLSVFKSRR